MTSLKSPEVAIVDFGLGNLFSIKLACLHAGLQSRLTSSKKEILEAEAVILPGVGAFGDAMAALEKLDLIVPLQDVAASGKILMGICLGMQLMMTESYEFGRSQGLGIIKGPVVRFDNPKKSSSKIFKVPQVGWNRISQVNGDASRKNSWSDSLLSGLPDGAYMYFVHSYYAKPEDSSVRLSMTRYGHIEFCSSLRYGNIFAFQFHPERSGPQGLNIYHNLAALLRGQRGD